MAKKKRNITDESKVNERQVEFRWTPLLASKGWTPVSDFFLQNYYRLNISHSEAMVLIHLISFKWDASQPYPSLATLAQRMGITIPSIRSHLRKLEGRKLLRRNYRIGTTTRFDLSPLFQALETVLKWDEAHSGDNKSMEW